MTFAAWLKKLDALGQKERIFDPPNIRFLCPGSKVRRPYTGEDGFFAQCFNSGMTPQQALGESLVEQDAE